MEIVDRGDDLAGPDGGPEISRRPEDPADWSRHLEVAHDARGLRRGHPRVGPQSQVNEEPLEHVSIPGALRRPGDPQTAHFRLHRRDASMDRAGHEQPRMPAALPAEDEPQRLGRR